MSFVKWTSIEGFHNVRKAVAKYGLFEGYIVYRGKIKLHGTNAGVVVKPNGDVFAQSRTSIIGTGNDNAGFAAWVESTKDYWTGLLDTDEQFTVFGEWCGPGIQKGVAINQVDEKQFVVFSIQLGEYDEDGNADMIIEPAIIHNILHRNHQPKNIHILPWYGDEVIVDYGDDEIMQTAVDVINKVVDEVERLDPWVKSVFGVEGTGEGLVYYPVGLTKDDKINRADLSKFMFKAKGEKHKVVKTKEAVQIDPEVAANVDEFVDLVVTEARLEQGVREIASGKLVFEHRLIGPFMGWFGKDVKKETEAELEASGLEWKQVAKAVQDAARKWYIAKIEEI